MLSVRLDTKTQNELNFIAKQRDVPKSKIIKEALHLYFELKKDEFTKKTPYELGAELFGRYSSSQTNLSTTYKLKLKEKLHAKNSHR